MKREPLKFGRHRNADGDLSYSTLDRNLRTWKFRNFGPAEWGITRHGDERATLWAESKEEAILYCELLSRGIEPNHRTRVHTSRRGQGNTTMFRYLSKWSCSCGESEVGSSDSAKHSRENARHHRIEAMTARIAEPS